MLTLLPPVTATLIISFILSLGFALPAQALSSQKAEIRQIEEHDPRWFTQGLYKEKEQLFISSGLYGKSAVIAQGKAPNTHTQRYQLNQHYFAEGLTVIDETLYLLTWKEKALLLFDKKTLKPKGRKSYRGEGWGLTHIPQSKDKAAEFIMSNGTNTLFFRDINTFEIKRKLKVGKLNYINELEYVDGVIWANRWYDNHLYGIDSHTGCILSKIDLLPLRKQAATVNHKNVANGVAYDAEKKGLWVTGKYWSKRFLISIPLLTKKHC